MVGGVHKPNEINSFNHLHIISHRMNKEYKQTVEIIKMKMFAIVILRFYGWYYTRSLNAVRIDRY